MLLIVLATEQEHSSVGGVKNSCRGWLLPKLMRNFEPPFNEKRHSKMTLHETRDTSCADYAYMEALLVDSFPREERRDLEQQRLNCRENSRFHPMLICDGEVRIGLINYWQLGDMAYIEHFATSPDMRGKGYGRMALEELGRLLGRIVLEVEMPESDLAQRRIGFYRRCGFSLCCQIYRQPPYRKGDGWLPMLLMFRGVDDMDGVFAPTRDEIHRTVYGTTVG